jgi:hypothetical protein
MSSSIVAPSLHSHFFCERMRCARSRALLIAFAWALSTAALADASEQDGKLAARTIDEFEVGASGEPLVLPVTIGKTTYRFLLDTGSIVCVLDDSFLDRVEPAPDAKISDAPEPAPKLYRPSSMRLGGIDFGRPECSVYPGFHNIFEINGINIDGILGMNVLRKHVVQIDFDRGTLCFLTAADPDARTALPLEARRGTFHVVGKLGGADTSFLVDTGNLSFYAGSLEKALFDRLLEAGHLRLFTDRQDNSWTSGGIVPIRLAESDGISLGPFKHDHVMVSDTAQDNKLGLGYLSRFEVTFDFPHSVMYVRPSKAFDRNDACVLGGFGLAHIRGRILFVEIEPAGAGAAAGLEQWDELECIEGAAVKDISAFAIARLFTKPGRVRITYRRDARQRETVLFLREPRHIPVGASGGKQSK